MKDSTLRAFARAAQLDCAYHEAAKAAWKSVGQAFFRALAKDLGAPAKAVRWNPGGIAVSGDHTLGWPEGGIYVHASIGCSDAGYYRGCTPKDPYGTRMQFVNNWFHAPVDQVAYARLLEHLRTIGARAQATWRESPC